MSNHKLPTSGSGFDDEVCHCPDFDEHGVQNAADKYLSVESVPSAASDNAQVDLEAEARNYCSFGEVPALFDKHGNYCGFCEAPALIDEHGAQNVTRYLTEERSPAATNDNAGEVDLDADAARWCGFGESPSLPETEAHCVDITLKHGSMDEFYAQTPWFYGGD